MECGSINELSRIGLDAVHSNGFIYAIGGDCEGTGRTVNDQWMFVSSLNVGRWKHGACILNDKIYVGGDRKSLFGNVIKRMECYNSLLDY